MTTAACSLLVKVDECIDKCLYTRSRILLYISIPITKLDSAGVLHLARVYYEARRSCLNIHHKACSRLHCQRSAYHHKDIGLHHSLNSLFDTAYTLPEPHNIRTQLRTMAALSPILIGTSSGTSSMQAGSLAFADEVTFLSSPCRCNTSLLET